MAGTLVFADRFEDAAVVFLEGSRLEAHGDTTMADLFQTAVRLGKKQYQRAQEAAKHS